MRGREKGKAKNYAIEVPTNDRNCSAEKTETLHPKPTQPSQLIPTDSGTWRTLKLNLNLMQTFGHSYGKWHMQLAIFALQSRREGWRLMCGRSEGWRIPTWLLLAKVNVIVKNCCCSLGKNHIACAMNYNVEHFNLYCGMWRLLRFSCFYPCLFFLCV